MVCPMAIGFHLRKGRVIDDGDTMRVGDLVRNIYTGEIGLITDEDDDLDGYGYMIVDNRWTVPKEHLEVISEGR